MMLKFLLFLCFTAVHVLGEGKENVLPKNVNILPNVTSSKHDDQSFEGTTSANKIISAEPVPVVVDSDKTKTKLEEISTTQSSTVSPTTANVISAETTVVPVNTNEPYMEHVSHTTNNPASTNVVIHPKTPALPNSHLISSKTSVSHGPSTWIVNKTSEICIVVQMSVMFNVSYTTTKNMTSFKVFDIPADNSTVNVSGSCGKMEQNMTLNWSSNNITNATMTLHFVKNETDKHYSFHHLEVVLPAVNFPNTTMNDSMTLVHMAASNYVIRLTNSYRCLKQQKFNLQQNNTNHTSGYLTVSDLQFQAFRADNSTVFGVAKDCAFDVPDVVPIAVGCALAGLVIIVLVAYLIGRQRIQSHGYLSM